MEKLNWKRFYIKAYPKSLLRNFLWIFLIIISVGGLIYPYIGWVVPVMMMSLLVLSFFKGRYWCGNFCPRGSFFDVVLNRTFKTKKISSFLTSKKFRIGFLLFFFVFFGWRVYTTFQTYSVIENLGLIFATLCFGTTIFGVVLAPFNSSRAWCKFCPMGTMQAFLHSVKHRFVGDKRKHVTLDTQKCVSCAKCSRVCPMQLEPYREALNSGGKVTNTDCIHCGICVQECPLNALSYSSGDTLKTGNDEKEITAKVEKTKNFNEATELTYSLEEKMSFEAGQYVLIKVSEEPLVYRAYSIIDVRDNKLSVCIKPVKDGFASPYLASMKPGEKVSLKGPRGDFSLGNETKSYFIAAGIGIAPFISMTKEGLKQGKKITLLQSAKNKKELYYEDELREKASENFEYIPLLTREKREGYGNERPHNYLKKLKLDKNAGYYICGTKEAVENVINTLTEKGIKKENILFEGF